MLVLSAASGACTLAVSLEGLTGVRVGLASDAGAETSAPLDGADVPDAPSSTGAGGMLGAVPGQHAGKDGDRVQNLAVLLPQPVHAGNTLLVGFFYGLQAVNQEAMLSDSLGTTFRNIVGPETSTTPIVHYLAVGTVPKDGADTITLSLSVPNVDYAGLAVVEYAGLAADPFDVGSSKSGTTRGNLSLAVSVTSNRGVLVAVCRTTGAATAGSGFVTQVTFNGHLVEDRLFTSAGPQTALFQQDGNDWSTLVAALKAR